MPLQCTPTCTHATPSTLVTVHCFVPVLPPFETPDLDMCSAYQAFVVLCTFSTAHALLTLGLQQLKYPTQSLVPLAPLHVSTTGSAMTVLASGTVSVLPYAIPSLSSVNASVINGRKTDCDGDIWGMPSISSCQDALDQIGDEDVWVDLGDRSRGEYDMPLPDRVTSRESARTRKERGSADHVAFAKEDGTCVIEIDLDVSERARGRYTDHAIISQLKVAAAELLETCIVSRREGGFTWGLGQL